MARPHHAYGYAGVDENVDVETVRRLTYFEAAYSEIKRAHGPEHTKGRTSSACLNKHVENIVRQPCKLFTNTCLICHDTGLLNIELLGLQDGYLVGETTNVNYERKAVGNESLVGGQGDGDVTCNY